MWYHILIITLIYLKIAHAQASANETTECPSVPGVFYQDDCKLLCQKNKWTDLAVFFLGNYIAHPATITTRPGQSTFITIVTMIGSALLPGTGIWNGIKAIVSRAKFATTDLQIAARAGALYTVVRNDKEYAKNELLFRCDCGVNPTAPLAAISVKNQPGLLTDGSIHQQQDKEQGQDEESQRPKALIYSKLFKILLRTLPISEASQEALQTFLRSWQTRLLSSNIHGTCVLPKGYCLIRVLADSTFEGEDEPRRDEECSWCHYQRWIGLIRDFFKNRWHHTQRRSSKSTPTSKLSCSYNFSSSIAAVVQLLFAISTLYRTHSDQIKRYGYAAFGLTVVPYAWMSLINLVGNLFCPQYDTIYVVRSRALFRLQETLDQRKLCKSQCRSREGDQPHLQLDGTVGCLTELAETELCHMFRVHLKLEQGKDEKKVSGGRKEAALLLFALLVPFLIYCLLSGFKPGKSALYQRVWTMTWLVFGMLTGLAIGQTFRDLGDKSPMIYQLHPHDAESEGQTFLEALFGVIAYSAVPIGGYVVVAQMIQEFGNCVEVN